MSDRYTLTSTQVVGLFDETETRTTSLENPNFNLQDAASWDAVFGTGYRTDSGVTVTAESALSCPPFWQAISLISCDCGTTPLSPHRRQRDGRREFWLEDTSHWTYSLVNYQANEYETAQEYWERLSAEALLWGYSYGLIWRDQSNRPSELLHLLPDRTTIEMIGGVPYVTSEINGKLEIFAPEDVLCIKGPQPLGRKMEAFYRMARNTIGISLAADNFTAKFFKNGCRAGGILELPSAMPKPVMQTVEEGFRKTYENSSEAFKTVILRDGAKFHQSQISPKDVQVIETSEREARDIARFFNLPASKLNIEGASAYNSKAEDGSGYVTHTLRPWLGRIAGQCRLKLLPLRERASIEFRHNTDVMFRMDLQARANAYTQAAIARWMSPNDIATQEGFPPHEGGDEYENPNTTSGSEPIAGPVEPVEPPDDEVDDEPTPSRAWQADEVRVVLNTTANARHKSTDGRAFEDFTRQPCKPFPRCHEFVKELSGLLDTATRETLPARVDEVCKKWEAEALGHVA